MVLVALSAELGASRRGSNKGVECLRQALIQEYPEVAKHAVFIKEEQCALDISFKYAKRFEDYYLFCRDALIPGMQKVFAEHQFPIILSSEHSNAFGIIQALRSQHPKEKIGILYLDAHADIHTAHDSHSGNIHGMPLGMVLNKVHAGPNDLSAQEKEYWQDLCSLGLEKGVVDFDPTQLVYFGVRSTERSEDEVIAEYNIPLFSVAQIREDMFGVVQKAKEHLKGIHTIYLSLDVDVMDGGIFTSTGVREKRGLYPHELQDLLQLLLDTFGDRLAAIEITEYNPDMHKGGRDDQQDVLELLMSATRYALQRKKHPHKTHSRDHA
ncbi:arginase [Helicobacter bizzozeronii]|uniref:arginase n=1 Tax=Helicobacter bizzozeronii TaxID=56877 RepID=UPI000CF1739F|nr:arginase [Helicobacter bizzozeronii]GMT39009.1 Arginase RocF [Helicobacter bizzozeronii]